MIIEYRNLQNGKLMNMEKIKSTKHNSLLRNKPDKWVNWDFLKNEELGIDIWKVTSQSNKRAWWICEKSHSYNNKIYNDNGRPYCSNQKVLKGFNDIWTTHPEIAKLLLNEEDGYIYTYGSSKKVDWKCNNCSNPILQKSINMVNQKNINCTLCSTGKSFGEKIMYSLLKRSNIDFESEKTFTWSNRKRYDYYIPSHNMIIEIHGKQHYEEVSMGMSLKEVQLIDEFKYQIAINNGINHYLIIDSELELCEKFKNNILKSGIIELLNIDIPEWNDLYEDSLNSNMIDICKKWNEGNYTVLELSKLYKLSVGTITNYLKRGTKLNHCYYNGKKEKNKVYNNNKKKVVQLQDGKFIKLWDSISEASNYYDSISASSITNCCLGKTISFKGYQWVFEKDYLKGNFVTKTNNRTRKIIQISLNGDFIREWNSIREASDHLGYYKDRSSISKCCSGKTKKAFGYKWKYKN